MLRILWVHNLYSISRPKILWTRFVGLMQRALKIRPVHFILHPIGLFLSIAMGGRFYVIFKDMLLSFNPLGRGMQSTSLFYA